MLSDFRVYQLAVDFYRACKALSLPRHLQEQMLRASSSIVLNIAEGSGKQTGPEQRRFYAIALGSLRECQAILEMEELDTVAMRRISDQIGAMLFKLCRPDNPFTRKESPNPN